MKNFEVVTIIIVLGAGILITTIRRLIINKPWLFKKQINHDQLGKLWFYKSKGPAANHFQAHPLFHPIKKEIDAYFDSQIANLDPKQVQLFFDIEDKYYDLFGKYLEYLRSSKIVTEYDYELYAVEIPEIANNDINFKLHFTDKSDFKNKLILSYKNFELIKIQ
jgi:hypothetical protein